MSLTNKTAAAVSDNTDLLTQSKESSRAAEKARLEARDEEIRQAEIAKQEAIAAKQAELAAIRQQEAAVPKSGQTQQGFRQEQGIYAGFSHNHRPVYVMNNVANFVPAYTESELSQLNTLFSQEVSKQRELDQLLGTDTASTLQPKTNPIADTRTGPNNTSINYEATLAARQAGYNVGSGIVSGLEPTFEKEQEKQFAEHNKAIGLTENITTERAKQAVQNAVQPNIPAPQNPRQHILTGQPDSKYANPDFGKPSKQVQESTKKQIHVLDSSLPVSSAEYSSGGFNLEGQNATAAIFGIAPKYPRVELTQEQVDKLSPAEYAAYRQEFDVYKQYADYASKQAKELKAAKKIIDQSNWMTYKSELLGYIEGLKAEGAKEVTIMTKQGFETIPINNAFLNIASRALSKSTEDDILNIFTPPVIPKGYKVAGVNLTGEGFTEFGSNPVGTLLLIPTEQPKPEPPQEKTGEQFWAEITQNTLRHANKMIFNEKYDPASRFIVAPVAQLGAEFLGSFIAIGGEISRLKLPDIRKAAGELFNGTGQNQTQTNQTSALPPGTITDRSLNQTLPPIEEPLPETPPSAFLSTLSTGAFAAAQAGNPSLLYAAAREAAARYTNIAQKQGLLPTIVQTALFVDPLAAVKAVPLRTTKLLISTETGPRVVEHVITLGYGTGRVMKGQSIFDVGRVIAGKYGEAGAGKYFLGRPNPALSGIEELKGATGSSFNVYELAGYTKRELGLLKPIAEYAEEKGLAPKGAFEQEMKQASSLELFKKQQIEYEKGFAKDELKTISPGIKSEEALGQGVKAREQNLLEKMKGSVVFTKIEGALKRQYGDIDFTGAVNKKAAKELTSKQKLVSELEEKALNTVKVSERTKFRERIGKLQEEISVLEKKVSEPSMKAADLLVQAPVEEGFAMGRRGANVFIGEAETKIVPLSEEFRGEIESKRNEFKGTELKTTIIPGTEKEVFNIVTPKEDLIDAIHGKGSKTDTVFGQKQPKDTVKFTISPTSKKTIESEGAKQQLTNKVKSTSGFMTRETIEEATNLTAQQKAEILGGHLFTYGGKAHRYVKENVDVFMGFREGARMAFKSGDKKAALQYGDTMAGMIRMKKGIDWGAQIREYKPDLEIPISPEEPKTIFESVASGVSTAGSKALKSGVQPYSGAAFASPQYPDMNIKSPKMEQPLKSVYESSGTKFTKSPSVMVSSGLEAFESSGLTIKSGGASALAKSVGVKSSGASNLAKSPKSGKSAGTSGRSAFATSPSGSVFEKSPSAASPQSSPAPSPFGSPAPSPFGSPSPQPSPSPSPSPIPSPSPMPSPVPSPVPSPLLAPPPTPTPKSPPPETTPAWFKVRTETDKKKDKKDDWSNFLGSTSEIQVEGMFNREIVYGKTKPARQERKETAFVQKKRGFTKFVTQRQGSILSKKQRSVLEREKPKVVKKMKKKTGGFF